MDSSETARLAKCSGNAAMKKEKDIGKMPAEVDLHSRVASSAECRHGGLTSGQASQSASNGLIAFAIEG